MGSGSFKKQIVRTRMSLSSENVSLKGGGSVSKSLGLK